MSSSIWIDQAAVADRLKSFFGAQRDELASFGSTVNQTFEAFVFAQVVSWYRGTGWDVTLVAPRGQPAGTVKLKFSTRGRPSGYTYARCDNRAGVVVQVRHGVRIATRHHAPNQYPAANVCLDVSVIEDTDLSDFHTNEHVDNRKLVTFGEAKHMSAFAELVANFIGLVHEMMPERLSAGSANKRSTQHLAPFLYVSGILYPTARGILETIKARHLDVSVYDHAARSFFADPLPTKPLVPKRRQKPRPPKQPPSKRRSKAVPMAARKMKRTP